MKFNKILTLYDFSKPGRTALHFAEQVASRFCSRLGIVHVWEVGPTYMIRDWGHQTESLKNLLSRRLYREVQSLLKSKRRQTPRSIKGILAAGEPKAAVLGVINDEKPDLVIMGTHGRTGILHVLMGSVAEGIVRRSPVPVWVARQPRRWPPKCILVPVDFDDSSRQILRTASELARIFSARLEILHVSPAIDNLAPFPEMRVYFPLTLSEDLRKRAHEKLESLVDGAVSPKVPVRLHVLSGSPVDVICRNARSTRSDLIVIPTHGRKGLARLVLGSVAEGVVRHASCSTLTFPARDRKRS